MATKARLIPEAAAPFPNLAYWLIAISPTHSGHRHTLLGKISRVVAEEEVEKFLLLIEHDGEIAVATCKIIILRIAFKGVGRRVEHDSQIVPGGAVVGGFGCPDARSGQIHFRRLGMRARTN